MKAKTKLVACNAIKKQTVGIRKDSSWWPWIVLALLGFFIGIGVVIVVAVHEMWMGGNFRYYPMQIYVFVGLIFAAIMVVVGAVLSWTFDVIEKEYLDD